MGDFTNSNRGARFAIRLPVDKRKHCSLSVIPFGTEIVLGKTVAAADHNSCRFRLKV